MIICFVLLSVNYHYSFDSLSAVEPSVWSKVFLERSAFKLFVFLYLCVCVWAQALYSLSCVYPQQYGLTTPDRTIDSTPWNKQIKNSTRKTTKMGFHSLVILSDRFPHLIISPLEPKCCTCRGFQKGNFFNLCTKIVNPTSFKTCVTFNICVNLWWLCTIFNIMKVNEDWVY